jgi:hypothetical protein
MQPRIRTRPARAPDPERYLCRILRSRGKRKVSARPSFSGLADRGGWKLYVVTNRGEFVYVGLTNKRAKTRLEQGLNEKKYGYKWKEWLHCFGLHVCSLPNAVTVADGECIEAELVHLVRSRKHTWPTGQHEIHFHNRVGAVELATKLYAKITRWES